MIPVPSYSARHYHALQLRAPSEPDPAHEEHTDFIVLVLVGVQDIGTMSVKKIGSGRHHPRPVRAVTKQDARIQEIVSFL